ncbi:MAG: DUF1203 domain-containing protein [Pseudobacteriovorax sp.]|nr:DUF1203 domain-containing protein [Pseudobacteriovorax sp.]
MFQDLFAMDDVERTKNGVTLVKAQCKPGYPCRVSLKDAEISEFLFLLNYEHLSGESPFRSSHAIFIRKDAESCKIYEQEIPKFSISGRLRLCKLSRK